MGKSKILLLVLGGIILLIAIAFFFLVRNLDGLVKAAIEKYGSEVAGTDVRVQTVEIELKAGRGMIRGLTVANPPGFSNAYIFTLDEIILVLDPSSLTTDLPLVEDIRISAPAFHYEVNEKLQTNLGMLQQNLKRYSKEKPTEEAERDSLRLLVKRLSIDGGEGTLDLTAVGARRMEAKVPPIILTNIGGRRGVTPAALGEAVLAALIRNLEQTAARHGVEQAIRGKLGEEADRLQQKLDEKVAPGTGEALKKLLGR